MNEQDAQRILNILKQYAPCWPNGTKILSQNNILMTYAVRFEELNIPVNIVEASLVRLLDTHIFFPAFSEILNGCEDIIRTANGTRELDDDEAWAEVYDAARRGQIPIKGWTSPQIASALKHIGGIMAITTAPAGSTAPIRAQFRDAYLSACRRTKNQAEMERAIASLPPAIIQKIKNIGCIPTTADKAADSIIIK